MKGYEKFVNAAQRICGCETCHAPFACNREHHSHDTVPKMGLENTCPLERYNVSSGQYERPTLDDVSLLCANCRHSSMIVRRKQKVFIRTGYVDVCVDCPVYAAEEAIYNEVASKYA